MKTAGRARWAGDFGTSDEAIAFFTGLISEANIEALLADATSDGAKKDQFDNVSHSLDEGGDWRSYALSNLVFVFSEGYAPQLAENLDKALSERLAYFAFMSLKPKADDQSKEDKAANEAILEYGRRAWPFIEHLKSALTMVFREPTRADIHGMATAADWLRKEGRAIIIDMLNDSRIGVRTDRSKGASNSRQADEIIPIAVAFCDSVGWAAALANNDVNAMKDFERAIFGQYRSEFRQVAPDLLSSVEIHLSPLEAHEGSAADRSINHLRLLLPDVVRAAQRFDDDGRERGDTDEQDVLFGEGALGYLMTPLAAADGRWNDITNMLDPLAKVVRDEVKGEPKPEPGVPIRLQSYGRLASLDAISEPIADYFYALRRSGRGAEILTLISPLLSDLKAIEESTDQDAEARRRVLAQVIPDSAAGQAASALYEQGDSSDALLLARIRMRKADLSFGKVRTGDIVRRERADLDRSAYEQVVEFGSAQLSVPGVGDDIAHAFDASRTALAADAISLRALATHHGPEAEAALFDYFSAQAQLDQALSTPVLGSIDLWDYGLGQGAAFAQRVNELAIDASESQAHLVAVLGSDSTALVGARVTLSQAQGALRPHEAMLSIMPVGNRIAELVLSDGERPLFAWSKASYKDIRVLNRNAWEVLRLRSPFGSAAIMQKDLGVFRDLYDDLIAPVETAVLHSEELTWSPDARLVTVPVTLFRRAKPFPGVNEDVSQWLGLAKGISVAPRLDALVAARAAVRPSSPNISSLAVGDIPFHGVERSHDLLSEDSRIMESAPTAAWILNHAPTPFAAPDLKRFADLTQARRLEREQATVTALKGMPYQELKFLLFHTHGVGIGDGASAEPWAPALLLNPPAKPTAIDSGILRDVDILQLRLKPEYVLLAACETGSPDAVGEEAYSGLVRSFLALGSRAVLTSEGDLDDRATSALVGDTVRIMVEDHQSPAMALRLAQRRMEGDPKFSDPRLWGQVVWVGDATSP